MSLYSQLQPHLAKPLKFLSFSQKILDPPLPILCALFFLYLSLSTSKHLNVQKSNDIILTSKLISTSSYQIVSPGTATIAGNHLSQVDVIYSEIKVFSLERRIAASWLTYLKNGKD